MEANKKFTILQQESEGKIFKQRNDLRMWTAIITIAEKKPDFLHNPCMCYKIHNFNLIVKIFLPTLFGYCYLAMSNLKKKFLCTSINVENAIFKTPQFTSELKKTK